MIYFDNNATTRLDDDVLRAMLPFFTENYGNASSHLHSFGWIAKDAVEQARTIVAETLSCTPQEIIFTSGATEALNIAIQGVFNAYKSKGKHIVVVKTEHSAVLDTCKFLETKGAKVSYLDVDANGQLDLKLLEETIANDTILVSVMLSNNETGIIQPIKQIAAIVHQKNSIFCCDTTQAFGKIPIHVDEYGIDLMPISGHKFHGPKGVGALYVRRKNPRVALEPLLFGGNQEHGKRSGTQNVSGIVGLGCATQIAYNNLTYNKNHILQLRDTFENLLKNAFGDDVLIVGQNVDRIYNTSNIIFPIKSQNILQKIKNKVAVSTGSACTTANNKPSHVLLAMQLSSLQAQSAIRFSFSKYNTLDEVYQTAELLKGIKA